MQENQVQAGVPPSVTQACSVRGTSFDYINKQAGTMYAFCYPRCAVVDLSFHVDGGRVVHLGTLTVEQGLALAKAITKAVKDAKRTGRLEYVGAFTQGGR